MEEADGIMMARVGTLPFLYSYFLECACAFSIFCVFGAIVERCCLGLICLILKATTPSSPCFVLFDVLGEL